MIVWVLVCSAILLYGSFVLAFVLGFGGVSVCALFAGLIGVPNVGLPGLGLCGSTIFILGLIVIFGIWMWKIAS